MHVYAAPLIQTDAIPSEQPIDEGSSDEILPPAMPAEPGAELIPTLPAGVTLTLDQPLLVVGEKVVLTLQVNSDFTQEVKEVSLTLTLPPGIQTDQGERGEIQWPLPALPKQDPFVQTLVLLVDADAVAAEGGLLTLNARLQAPGYQTSDWSIAIGVATDHGAADAVVEQRHGKDGFVLQDGTGFLTLLAPAAAVTAGTTVRYTELYRWEKAAGETREGETRDQGAAVEITPTVGVTATMALSQTGVATASVPLSTAAMSRLFLPVVIGGNEVAVAAVTAEIAPVDLPPTRDDGGVQLYYQWAFEAEQADTKVSQFDEALQLSLSLTKLVEAGVDPTILELWTRESEKAAWTVVRSTYDAKSQRLTAFLPHFTQFGLGAGLSHHGEILPSTVGFATDRLTGSASVQHPIETPSGVGGLNPNLSFSYSSMASDDLFLDSGQDYLSQTSGVGMGWGVSGSNNFVVHNGGYSVVLNGMRLNLRYEENAWRTDPETFYQVYRTATDQPAPNEISAWGTWTLIAPNGTKYEFGDPNPFTGYVATSPTAVFFETKIPDGSTYKRVPKQWYLRQVTDPLGNYITYHYNAEKGIETGCIDNHWPTAERWYTRAVYPTEIRWGGNIYTGLTPKMKVLFTYSTADREDYQIDDWGSTDCKQVKFATRDRLLDLTVQVDSSGWKTLRKYELTQSYYTTASKKRLLLNSIKTRGKDNGLLRTESYTYKYGDAQAAGPNRIWLTSADNGWGGKITYQYTSHRPECPTALCEQNTERGWRAAVTRTIVDDGVGNRRFVDYYYGPTNNQNDEWGRIGLEDTSAQFFGFKESQATYYALAPAATLDNATLTAVSQWDKHESWPGAQDNADPRAGKPKKIEVRLSASPTAEVVAVTNYNWIAYRRDGGAWQATTKNRETNDGITTFPIIWVRQESSDSWTAGGAWSGNNFINGNGSGTQTRNLFDNTPVYRGYGNIVEAQAYSHSETHITKATWDNRVSSGTGLTALRRTLTDYFPGSDVRNAPARVRVFDGTSCKSELRYIYDNVNGNYNGAPTAGVLKKTEQPNASCSDIAAIDPYDPAYTNWIVTRMAHDSYGNVVAQNRVGTTAGADIVIETRYDNTYHLFPLEQWYSNTSYKETATYYGVNSGIAGIVNGIGLSDGKAAWGAMQEHCGVNEICTRQSYDEYGRPLRTWAGVLSSSTWVDSEATLLRTYTAYTPGWTRNVVEEERAPRCNGNFVRKLYDGLGQLLQEQRPQQNWGTSIDDCNGGTNSDEVDVNYQYDAFGRQTKVSVPIATSANYVNRAAVWNQGDTETVYDAAGRPARSYAPNEERTDYAYSGRSTAVFAMGRNGDPNKVVKWQETDGLGYLKALKTYNKPFAEGGTVQATLTLGHDVLGNLRTVTHPNSIGATTIDYDLASRKISMTDPDLGYWTYSYNRQNQLVRQKDARDKYICLYYDGFERLQGKRFPSNSTCPTTGGYGVLYAYDQGHSGTNRSRGQVTYVSNGDQTKWIEYNSKGQLAQEIVRITGAPQDYTTKYGYDAYQRPTTTTYPDNEVVTVSYNSMGLPKALATSWWPAIATLDNVSYDEAGRLRQYRLTQGSASGADDIWRVQVYQPWTSTNGYSPNGWTSTNSDRNGRLQYIAIGTYAGAGDRYGIEYQYDSFGNVKRAADWSTLSSSDNSFTYDEQNRLTNGYGRPYSYDASGRLTNYEWSGYTGYRGHGVTHTGSERYRYDANGNMTTRWYGLSVQQELTWNHENRLSTITGGGLPTESYLYDADGQRVKKTSNGVSTYYPNQYYEQTGTSITKYYYFNGQRVAMRTNASGSWAHYDLHSDHLGSTVFVTAQGGNAVSGEGYYAYGRNRSGGVGVTDYKFSGQKRDGTGLQYFNARYYDPELGTFISPDTIVPDAGNLFDYNRYMFVRGNPLKYVDANGHEPIHHSNYPCSYTACVRDGGNVVSVSQWTPELHQRYYGAGSHLEQELPTLEEVHLALDVVGTVDPTGVADGANGVIYLAQGNYADAGLSALAILPLGDMAKGLRYTDEAVVLASKTFSGKTGRNVFDGLVDGQKLTQTDVLDAGMAFLGDGYKELDSGVFVSADGTRLFRITTADLVTTGNHAGAPHANFQLVQPITKPNGGVSYKPVRGQNKHIFFDD